MTSRANIEAKLISKYMEFAKQMNRYLNHFPRHEKFGLALSIRNSAYSVFDLIVEAQKRYHKKTTLTNLDITHEQLRMKFMLAHELGYLSFKSGAEDDEVDASKRFLAINRMIDEMGRMIGGWIRYEVSDKEQ